MLQRCFRQPSIPRIAQIKTVNALADRPFDPGSSLVASLKCFCFLAYPGRLQGVVLRLWPQLQDTWSTRCTSTRCTSTTRATRVPIELDLDHPIPVLIVCADPTSTCLALRTVCLLRLPVNRETGQVKTLLGLCLPTGIAMHRPDQVDALPLALGDQIRSLRIPRFGQMHLVAIPSGIALGTESRIGVIGRANQACRWRQFLFGAQTKGLRFHTEVLVPDLAQQQYGGMLAHHFRCCLILGPIHQLPPVSTDRQRQSFTFSERVWKPKLVKTRSVTIPPGRWDDGACPEWRIPQQQMERRGQGFTQTFQPIECADGRQHVRGIGALPSARFDKPAVATGGEKVIQQGMALISLQ